MGREREKGSQRWLTASQDLGNTNYSFHIARELFTRQQHAELVARALNGEPIGLKDADGPSSGSKRDLGNGSVGAYVNKRNDICISLKDRSNGERKISGSAYKIISARAYHHGTMLLSSNLSHLGSALRPSRTTMQSKGVESVPSPVSNLKDAFASRANVLSHAHFCQAVLAEFQRTYGEAAVSEVGEDDYAAVLGDSKGELQAGWQEMDSWEWIWGQTPEFHHRIRSDGLVGDAGPFEIDLHVKSGIVQSAELRTDSAIGDDDLGRVVGRLQGKRYNDLADAPGTFSSDVVVRGLDELPDRNGRRDREAGLAGALLVWFKEVL